MSIPAYNTYELSRRADGQVNVWAYLPIRYPPNSWGTGADWVLVGVEPDWGAGMRKVEQVKRERLAKQKIPAPRGAAFKHGARA